MCLVEFLKVSVLFCLSQTRGLWQCYVMAMVMAGTMAGLDKSGSAPAVNKTFGRWGA